MSHPSGVTKSQAPRSVIAPGGVPRSSGTTNARTIRLAASSSMGGFGTANATSVLSFPMLPTGSDHRTAKSGSHFPAGFFRKYLNSYWPSPRNSTKYASCSSSGG